jgi:biopolymer transport protein ExbD
MRTPLGILERVPVAPPRLAALPLVLALACGALAGMLASPLAHYRGLYLSLDGTPAAVPRVPTTAQADLARVGAVATLVSARGEGTYLLEGRILRGRDALAAELRRLAANPARRARPLLVRADRSQTLQSLADLADAARAAGFPGILLAADNP